MTTLQEIRQTKRYFGFVTDIHEIGDYAIVECGTADVSSYHAFINGVSVGVSTDTLDGALVQAISIKYDGRNTQAGHFIARMIGMNK